MDEELNQWLSDGLFVNLSDPKERDKFRSVPGVGNLVDLFENVTERGYAVCIVEDTNRATIVVTTHNEDGSLKTFQELNQNNYPLDSINFRIMHDAFGVMAAVESGNVLIMTEDRINELKEKYNE